MDYHKDIEYWKSVGERIRNEMDFQKVSVTRMSERADESVTRIEEWISGSFIINIRALMKIARTLNVSIDYLLLRTEDPQRETKFMDERTRP